MPEVTPDKETLCRRYQLVTLGDGNEYRVARAGAGKRSDDMRKAFGVICDSAAEECARSEAIVQLCSLSLGVFYADDRIAVLFDECLIGIDHVGAIVDAVFLPDEADEKKTSVELNSPKQTGG